MYQRENPDHSMSMNRLLAFRSPVAVSVLLLSLIFFVSCANEVATETPAAETVVTEPDSPVQESPSVMASAEVSEEATNAGGIELETPTPQIEATKTVEIVTQEATKNPDVATGPTVEPDVTGLPTEMDILRAEIESNVIELRGLEPLEPVTVTLLDRDQLRQRIEDEILDEYTSEDARTDALVLSAFDFVPRDFDLYGFTLDLLTEEIAGYYDPETHEFVLINEDEEIDVLEQMTHAHEFVHALQDQYYDLEQIEDDSLDSEASLALTALAEGDATLVQSLYLISGYLSPEELMEALTLSLDIETPVLDNAPPVLARELLFPYIDGVAFAEALYARGGFDAIDQAWENPPQSSEQILHPESYLQGDEPLIVSLAPLTDTLGTGWQLLDEDIVGELYLREYLDQQLEDSQVETAATGWGGDRYAVYWNEDEEDLVLLVRLAWDSPADAEEFFNAYQEYPDRLFAVKYSKQPDGGICWQSDEVICLYDYPSQQTIIIRAPTLDLASSIAAQQIAFMQSE